MKKIAFALALIAATLCLSKFAYDIIKYDRGDYFILGAGLFILAIGIINKTRNHTQP